MSCNGESNFGYIKVEEDHVISYTGAPEDPEIHKFCNDEIVQAVKLLRLMNKKEKEWGDELDSHEDIDFGRNNLLWELEKKFRIITGLLEESKK